MSLDTGRSRMAGAPHRPSVVDLIKDFIVRNELRPDEPLPTESELGLELGVSRSSIREAIRTLAAFDIVEVRHGHGTYVGRLSLRALVESLAFRSLLGDNDDQKVVLDLVEIRQMLEVGMIEQIIAGVQGGLADRLLSLTDAMAVLAAQGRDHLEEDREFHLTLMTPLDNELVRQFTGAFWDVHSIVGPGGSASAVGREATVQAHRDIVEASLSGKVGAPPRRDALLLRVMDSALILRHTSDVWRPSLTHPVTTDDVFHPCSEERMSRPFVRTTLGLVAASALALAGLPAIAPSAHATPPTPLLDYSTSATFNGTTDYVDHSADLASVASLASGTIVARFQSTSAAAAKTLLSVSDVADPSSNLTLSVNNAALHYEVRENAGAGATFATNLTYPTVNDPAGSYNDGRTHTVAVTVGSEGTRIFADGHQVYAGTSTAFFDDVAGLDGMWVGRNVDNGGGQWYFNGTIASVQIYNTALSAADVQSLSPAPATTLAYTVNQSFNGTSTYIDKTADLSTVSGLTKGTIAARFQTTSTAAVKTILSMADTSNASSNATLSINNGALYFESRSNGTYTTQLSAPGTYNDGAWHTVAVTVGPAGTIIYGDGYRVGFASGTGFAAAVSGLNGMWVGRNVDNGGGQWYFNGTIDWVRVYSAPLTDTEVKTATATAPQTYRALFDNGYAASANYRIPSLLVTSSGTLIAGADQRESSAADSPNDITLVIRRSTDSGSTWGGIQTLLDYPGTGSNGASAIDSEMVQDSSTGRIYLLVDHFPGGVGQSNNVAGTGFDASGYLILKDTGGASYTLRSGGQVYNASGVLTSYTVNAQGDVSNSGSPAGNIYLKDGVDPNQSLLEARTSFLKLMYSDDDGATWSAAADLNAQVKASWMKFMGTSPGNGIQMQHGTHAGRLVFPVYYNNSSGVMSTAVVYSDDHGATWARGESPNDGRVFGGSTINSQTVTSSSAGLHEGAVTEQADGTLVLRMRNSSGTGKIAVASSTDGGATWGAVTSDNALPDVFCQPSALAYPDLGDGVSRVLFGNTTRTGRQDGFIRLSIDGGATWKYSRNIKAGGYAYNSIGTLPGGDLVVLWELQDQGLYFSRLPLSWLTDSRS